LVTSEALGLELDLSGDGRGEDSELRASVIDDELSQASETELTRYIGPMARVLVKRAAERSRSLEEFRIAIAQAITDPADRSSFLGALDTRAGEGMAEATPAPTAAEPVWALADDEADRVARLLAEEIGPLAKVMVKRAAKEATSRQAFYHRLVGSIDDRAAQARFLERLAERAT
jgi:serine/threonine-protein kinase